MVSAHDTWRGNLTHTSGVAIHASALEVNASCSETGAIVHAVDAHARIEWNLAPLSGELRATEAAGRKPGPYRNARSVVEAAEAQAGVKG